MRSVPRYLFDGIGNNERILGIHELPNGNMVHRDDFCDEEKFSYFGSRA